MTKAADLLPELKVWSAGKGISPTEWLFLGARSDMGVAFSDLFWPTFLEFEGHVFREHFSLTNVRAWQVHGAERRGVEAAVNIIHTYDLFVPNGDEWSELVEQRAIHIGRILSEIYSLKLERDFPDKVFEVRFCDGSDPEDDDIYLTFFQA